MSGSNTVYPLKSITQFIGGSQAAWNNITQPIPAGMIVYATDTTVVKMGDGVTLYVNLPTIFTISEVIQLTSAVETLITEVAANTSAIGNINTEITSIQQNITGINFAIVNIDSDVSSITTQLENSVTVLRQELAPIAGSASQPFFVGPATQGTQAPQLAQVVDVSNADSFSGGNLSVTPSALKTIIILNESAPSTITINQPYSQGAEIEIRGSGASTATTTVTLANAANVIFLPDGSNSNSITIPATFGAGVHMYADKYNGNWRATTYGQTVGLPATMADQYTTLGQINGSYEFLISGLTQPTATISDCYTAPVGYSTYQPSTINGPTKNFGILYRFSQDGSPSPTSSSWQVIVAYDVTDPMPYYTQNIDNAGWTPWQKTASQSWTNNNFLNLTGGTITGPVVVQAQGNATYPLSIIATNDQQGAGILLSGNGSSTPNKTIRANSGYFQIVNDAYNSIIFQLDNSGNVSNINSLSSKNVITNYLTLSSSDGKEQSAIYCDNANVNPGNGPSDLVLVTGNAPNYNFNIFKGDGSLIIAQPAVNGDEATQLGQVQAMQGSYSQVIAPDQGGTLTISQMNSYIQLAGPVTLPVGVLPVGYTIHFKNDSTANQTISIASGSGAFIYSPSQSAGATNASITLVPGDDVELVSRGGGEWDIGGGTWLIRNLASPYYAALAGNSSQPFDVGAGTTGTQTLQRQQIIDLTHADSDTSGNFTLIPTALKTIVILADQNPVTITIATPYSYGSEIVIIGSGNSNNGSVPTTTVVVPSSSSIWFPDGSSSNSIIIPATYGAGIRMFADGNNGNWRATIYGQTVGLSATMANQYTTLGQINNGYLPLGGATTTGNYQASEYIASYNSGDYTSTTAGSVAWGGFLTSSMPSRSYGSVNIYYKEYLDQETVVDIQLNSDGAITRTDWVFHQGGRLTLGTNTPQATAWNDAVVLGQLQDFTTPLSIPSLNIGSTYPAAGAAILLNMPSDYQAWLMQLAIGGKLLFHVDNNGNAYDGSGSQLANQSWVNGLGYLQISNLTVNSNGSGYWFSIPASSPSGRMLIQGGVVSAQAEGSSTQYNFPTSFNTVSAAVCSCTNQNNNHGNTAWGGGMTWNNSQFTIYVGSNYTQNTNWTSAYSWMAIGY